MHGYINVYTSLYLGIRITLYTALMQRVDQVLVEVSFVSQMSTKHNGSLTKQQQAVFSDICCGRKESAAQEQLNPSNSQTVRARAGKIAKEPTKTIG